MKTLQLFVCLFLTAITFGQTPTLDWGFSSGSQSAHDLVNEINITPQNNLLITGACTGTIDLDFGPGTFEVGAWGYGSRYFAEYDTLGNLNWAINFLDFNGFFYDVQLDPAGNIYAVGDAYSDNVGQPDTLDFDPGAGVYDLEVDRTSQFLIKLDPNGNFLDAKILASGSNSGDQIRPQSLKLDDNLEIYICGFMEGDIDLNPGGTPNPITTNGVIKGFVEKLDVNGNTLWFHLYEESWLYDLEVDPNNNIVVGGYFRDSMDFDFGPGTDWQFEGPQDSTISFLQKIDPVGNSLWSTTFSHGRFNHVADLVIDDNGNIYSSTIGGLSLNGGNLILQKHDSNANQIWERTIGGNSDFGRVYAMHLDSLDNVYYGGTYIGLVDFDPNPYTEYLDTATAMYGNNFFLKMSPAGGFIWEFSVATFGWNAGMQELFQIDADNNVYVFNNFEETVDIDPGPGTTNLTTQSWNFADVYFMRYSQGPCANMYTEVDTAYNWSCSANGWIATSTYNGTAPYTYLWNSTPPSDSANVVATSSGIYELTVTDAIGCVTEKAVLINGPTVVGGYDLNINAITSYVVVGDTTHIWLDAFNDGCVPQDGEITFVIPNEMDAIVSVTPPPTQTIGDTMRWDFPTSIYGDPHYLIHIMGSIDTLATVGDTMCFDVSIMPDSTDAFPNNNVKTYCKQVVASYDPNYKEVYPEGECAEKYILTNETLTYTVHFQNTGTFQAFNIRVRDEIDANLDVSSIRVLAQSDPLWIEVLPNNTVDFHFDDINLPDSASNEPESHGWVVFEIDPLPGGALNTVVENDVEIYFDYNDPILTNTVFNTYIDTIDCFLGVKDLNEDEFVIYPNPSDGIFTIDFGKEVSNNSIVVYALDGRVVHQISAANGAQVELNLQNQPEGMYWVQIEGDLNGTRKILLK